MKMRSFKIIFFIFLAMSVQPSLIVAEPLDSTLDVVDGVFVAKPIFDEESFKTVPSNDPIDVSSQRRAFTDATSSIMPMNKSEISIFRELLREYSSSAQHRPDLVKRSTLVSIDDRRPIYAVAGYVTTVNFVDANGTPWPIEYALPSNLKLVLVGKVDDYTLMMSAKSMAGETNLVVKLKGIDLPLNFYVYASDETLDSTLVIQMHGQSPDYKSSLSPVSSSIPSIKSEAFLMEQFLSETPPSSAVEKTVNRKGIRVWVHDQKMYVRSTYILASPMAMSNQGTVSNGRGTYVYRLSKPVSRLNMLIEGRYFSVRVSAYE